MRLGNAVVYHSRAEQHNGRVRIEESGDGIRATEVTLLALLASLLFLGDLRLSREGLLLAALSGAVASGLGYVAWYAALKGLTAARAATVQLSVPALAAVGGVLLLAEPVTPRLVMASAATLGGIAVVLAQKTRRRPR